MSDGSMPGQFRDLHEVPMFLTPCEAARLLRTSKGAIYCLVKRREIPVIRIGRRLLFDREELLRWLARLEHGQRKAA